MGPDSDVTAYRSGHADQAKCAYDLTMAERAAAEKGINWGTFFSQSRGQWHRFHVDFGIPVLVHGVSHCRVNTDRRIRGNSDGYALAQHAFISGIPDWHFALRIVLFLGQGV